MKAAVVYWSGTGNTEAMANAVLSGMQSAGADAELITADSFCDPAPYGAIAFGCPAMGNEELEDSEFQPMFDSVKKKLGGKKVGLFGSYGWGGGDWMASWEQMCRAAGIVLAADSVICNGEPDADANAQCEALGQALVK